MTSWRNIDADSELHYHILWFLLQYSGTNKERQRRYYKSISLLSLSLSLSLYTHNQPVTSVVVNDTVRYK